MFSGGKEKIHQWQKDEWSIKEGSLIWSQVGEIGTSGHKYFTSKEKRGELDGQEICWVRSMRSIEFFTEQEGRKIALFLNH